MHVVGGAALRGVAVGVRISQLSTSVLMFLFVLYYLLAAEVRRSLLPTPKRLSNAECCGRVLVVGVGRRVGASLWVGGGERRRCC